MVVIDRCAVADKQALHTRERHHIETLGASLNRQVPLRTSAEYRANNSEAIKTHMKQYRANNAKHCDFCNKTFGGDWALTRHELSTNHKRAHDAEFKRVFGEEY
jgi:hypothetical protein